MVLNVILIWKVSWLILINVANTNISLKIDCKISGPYFQNESAAEVIADYDILINILKTEEEEFKNIEELTEVEGQISKLREAREKCIQEQIESKNFIYTIFLNILRGASPWSSGSVLDDRSLPPRFESRRGHIWKLFHLWLRFITFGGRSVHLAYHVHKSGRKTLIIILNLNILTQDNVIGKISFTQPCLTNTHTHHSFLKFTKAVAITGSSLVSVNNYIFNLNDNPFRFYDNLLCYWYATGLIPVG